MRKFIITTALVGFMAAPVALAQDDLTFNEVDADDDYQISLQEIKSAAPDITNETVEDYDIDNNEVLTWSEFQKWKAGDDPAYRRFDDKDQVRADVLTSETASDDNS